MIPMIEDSGYSQSIIALVRKQLKDTRSQDFNLYHSKKEVIDRKLINYYTSVIRNALSSMQCEERENCAKEARDVLLFDTYVLWGKVGAKNLLISNAGGCGSPQMVLNEGMMEQKIKLGQNWHKTPIII
jgi:hypothetical protein